jgi:hypothetical protein
VHKDSSCWILRVRALFTRRPYPVSAHHSHAHYAFGIVLNCEERSVVAIGVGRRGVGSDNNPR